MGMKLKKIVLWVFVVLLLLIGGVVVGTILLKDKLIQKGIAAINNELNTPVSVDKISFSLLNNFPYASIVLKNVVVMSPTMGFDKRGFRHTTADTLLKVNSLSLSFNVKRLLDNELELNSMKVVKGKAFVLIDDKGNDNFHVLKSKTQSETSSEMQIKLENIEFDDFYVQVSNKYKANGFEGYLPHFEINGKYASSQLAMATKGNVVLQWVEANGIEIVPLTPTAIKMDLTLNNDTLLINEGSLSSKGLNLGMHGRMNMGTTNYIDLDLYGKKIEVAKALQYLRLATKEKPAVQSSGLVNFTAKVKGKFDKKSTPLIVANFGLSHAAIKYQKLNLQFKDVNLKGEYNNGGAPRSQKSFLKITDIVLKTSTTVIDGSLRIDNFRKPKISTALNIDGDMAEWSDLVFADKSMSIEGKVVGNVSMNGLVDFNNPFDVEAVEKLSPNVQVRVDNAAFTDGGAIKLSELSGEAVLRGNLLKVAVAEGRLRDVPVSYTGSITNLLSSIRKPYPAMNIGGVLTVGDVDYKQIAPLFAGGESESNISYNVDIQTLVSSFVYNKFEAERVSGRLLYKNDRVEVRNLNFYTLEGRTASTLVYKLGKNGWINCKGEVNSVDVNKLFTTFDNFGQDYIKSENISGELTSDFKVIIPFKNDTIDSNNIDFDGTLKLVNGKLNNVETINSIAEFTNIDEFRNIEFSTLTNTMQISEGVITIPKMNVESNAFDIDVAGKHKFNGDYEYHLRLVLSDFMRGKAKRLKQKNTQFGIVEDDAENLTSVFLLASSEGGKSKIRFDKVEMKQHFQTEMRQQKQEVKQILKNEFGLFKKDTTLKAKEETTLPKPEFVIEWDDE